jgi:hypothetical protein
MEDKTHYNNCFHLDIQEEVSMEELKSNLRPLMYKDQVILRVKIYGFEFWDTQRLVSLHNIFCMFLDLRISFEFDDIRLYNFVKEKFQPNL